MARTTPGTTVVSIDVQSLIARPPTSVRFQPMLPRSLQQLRDQLSMMPSSRRSDHEERQLADLTRLDALLDVLRERAPLTESYIRGDVDIGGVTKSFGGGGTCRYCGR